MTAAVGGLSSNVALEEAHNVTAGAGGGEGWHPRLPTSMTRAQLRLCCWKSR